MLQSNIKSIGWNKQSLRLLDQRKLPAEEVYLELTTAAEVSDAICSMVVRGAPAIGITAAYAVVLAALQHQQDNRQAWARLIELDIQALAASRPTAVNLHWALDRMRRCLHGLMQSLSEAEIIEALQNEAISIHQQDLTNNYHMAELGAQMITAQSRLLTHCNTGSLATGGYGTALGVIRTAFAEGKVDKVYAGETRPWLQGVRLTAWELAQDGIPVTLICDTAASSLFSRGAIDWVIVGADRVAANGDVANKIGTYTLAVLARYHQAKLMVVAPTSSIDCSVASGADIPIECRGAEELLAGSGMRLDSNIDTWNPVFDITPASLVDVLITEKGLLEQPTSEKINNLLA